MLNLTFPIEIESLADNQLLEIVEECQKDSFDSESIVRKLAIQFFGNDNLIAIIGVSNILLPVIATRMKHYSPYITT